MKTKSLIVLLLAGIWGVGSWWWYTCKVKSFCGTETTAAQVAVGTAVTGVAALPNGDTTDTDGDGIPDAKEKTLGLDSNKEDSDGDGISDFIELARDPQDTDGDGKIDALDDDDDGDGVLTATEKADPNGDGNVDDATDTNNNQLADYLDPAANGSDAIQAADVGKTDANKVDTDKAAAEAQAKADADKAAAEAQAKADADKAAAEAQAKADADKAAAEAQAKAETDKADADKVTMETTSTTQNGDISPAVLTFPTGSANPQLATSTKEYFEKVAQFLKDNSSAKVTIVGHTDNKGDPAKNKALGLKRAEMLQKTLIDLGAPKDRVSAASEGADKPIADNNTEDGRKKNRRVEITPVK